MRRRRPHMMGTRERPEPEPTFEGDPPPIDPSPAQPPSEFWHVRHNCGHAVFWSRPDIAVAVAGYPCPWCGAEDGKRVPQDLELIWDADTGVVAFRRLLPDRTVPWPAGLPYDPDAMVTLRHMANELCCTPITE